MSPRPDDGELSRATSPSQHQARLGSGQADSRQFSSSLGSPTHREPTRSFIPGSVQDHLCKFSALIHDRSNTVPDLSNMSVQLLLTVLDMLGAFVKIPQSWLHMSSPTSKTSETLPF